MRSPTTDLELPPADRPRRLRRGLVLCLLAAVLWLHGLLIGRLLPGRAPQGRVGAAALQRHAGSTLQVRTLVAAPALSGAVAPTGGAARVDRAPAPSEPSAPSTLFPLPAGPTRPAPAQAAVAPDAPIDAAVEDLAARAAESAIEGEPPPVYPTRLPAPTRLSYQLRYGAQTGQAVLAWQHDGQRYVLQLAGRGGAAVPLIEQLSQGGFDAAGLAPDRFTDRRRGRGQRAANFRRDIGRISFSGPQVDYPAWPGAQDRLSWLAQMVAIQAGAAQPLTVVKVFVVDARGGAELWRFEPRGEAEVDTLLGRTTTRHWLREPERPEGQRVEVWLDPGRGHWPVQIRYTSLRSGAVSELLLAAEPVPPP